MAYDEKMNFYHSVVEDIASQTLDKGVEFAMLHMGPLARALQENATRWVMNLGKLLNDSARESLTALDKKLDVNNCVFTRGVCSINFWYFFGRNCLRI